jgi:GNAT superfamily N-acetyltransferase
LRPISDLPPSLGDLHAESVAAGFTMLTRLRDEWLSGANRFDGPGELLLGAYVDGRLAGVGGVTRDPYLEGPGIGRLRHVYVLSSARRTGVGAALVRALIDIASGEFAVLRLSSAYAGPFYEALGFEKTIEARATHRLTLR